MSFHISKATLRAADSVTITFDTEKLGRIQRSALCKALQTGITWQWSVPHRIAKALREEAGLPTIDQRWELRWSNLPHDHEMFPMLEAAAVAALLEEKGTHRSTTEWHQKVIAEVRARPTTGQFAVYGALGDDFYKQLKPLAPYTEPVGRYVTITLDAEELADKHSTVI